MSIPEESVKPDSDHPMTGAGSDLDEKPPSVVFTSRSSSDWEEPHPGQRYPVPPTGTASNGFGDSQQCNGTSRTVMAAKVYAPYPERGWVSGSRRFLRPRLRTTALKPLKIPATPQQAGSKRASCALVNSNNSSMRPLVQSPAPAPMLERISANAQAVSPMYGCETGNGAVKLPDDSVASSAESALSSKHSSMRFSITDFSGHLASPGPEESDQSSCMSLERDTSPDSISPDEDPYGWEAELEKKVAAGDISCCSTFQYRRAGDGKRTLLQKVLSLGPRDFGRSAMP